AQRRRALEPHAGLRNALAAHGAERVALEIAEDRLCAARAHADDRPAPVAYDVAEQEAERREVPRERRHDDARHSERRGELARVQAASAAEAEQRGASRVVAALDRDDAQRALHVRRGY